MSDNYRGPMGIFEGYGEFDEPKKSTITDMKVSPEEATAWCNYEPIGQFNETMSFARFNGMMRHAFISGFKAARSD